MQNIIHVNQELLKALGRIQIRTLFAQLIKIFYSLGRLLVKVISFRIAQMETFKVATFETQITVLRSPVLNYNGLRIEYVGISNWFVISIIKFKQWIIHVKNACYEKKIEFYIRILYTRVNGLNMSVLHLCIFWLFVWFERLLN